MGQFQVELDERLELYFGLRGRPSEWVIRGKIEPFLDCGGSSDTIALAIIVPLQEWVRERRRPKEGDGKRIVTAALRTPAETEPRYDSEDGDDAEWVFSISALIRIAIDSGWGLERLHRPAYCELNEFIRDDLAERIGPMVDDLLADIDRKVPPNRGRSNRQRNIDDRRRKRLEQRGRGLAS
jgi:hypothetical protein